MLHDRSKKVKKKLTLTGLFGIVTPHTEQHKQHMRTKTLLLTAALVAVGAASSMAQVYSQNAVGYINVTSPAGRFAMIAHQLNTGAGSRSIATLLGNVATVPPRVGTTVVFFTPSGTQTATFDPDEGTPDGWTPSGAGVLALGGGAYVFTPAGASQTFTFVGDVPQGTLSTPVTQPGFLFYSSTVPQAGRVQADLGFIPNVGDTIFRLSPTGQAQSSTFDPDEGTPDGWTPAQPSFAVGEAFLMKPITPHVAWTRVFSVN